MNPRPLRTYRRLLAACLASLFLSTGATYFFYRKWSESEDWYHAEKISKDTLASKNRELQSAFDKNYSDLTVMRNENNSLFYLQSADSTKKYTARVYWNRFTHETFIDVQNLPPCPDGRQYQLWAISAEQPVNAGLIVLQDDRTLIPMKNIDKAERWSITLEQAGGGLVPDSLMLLVSRN